MLSITDLKQTLGVWTRRLRLQRALTWALRGWIVGLALSLTLGSLGLYQARLLRDEFLFLILLLSLITPLLFGLIAYLWPIQPLNAARRFDLLFHLKERVSTAFELNQHPEDVPAEILSLQLEDAVTASRKVNANRALPLGVKSREGLLALLFVALIGLVWLRGETWFNAARQARAVQQAVEQQTAQIEELIKQIEANENLTEAQKQALTEPLKEAQQALQNNPSLENSVSVLTSTGEKMQALSDPQAQAMSEALQQTGTELSKQDGSPLQSVGQELAQGDVVNAANELANLDVSQLSSSEQAQLADQLDALAQSLQSTNPQLASQLSQAAEALRNGDPAAAQQALSNAAQSMAQTGQQLASSQTASQAASQMQQGAGQVLAAGGGQQQANQSGQGNQPGQGQGPGQGSNQGDQTSGSGGSGSGTGSSTGTNSTGSEAGSDPIAQNNGPGDGGETSYEQIYAPQLLGGEGGPQVGLPGSGENDGDVIGQGPTTPGQPGTSTVPYNEVYSQYEQINNQAIENSDIPAQFMQIIKNYFDSLKP
ncbi:MAG TPA: hypothetical protein VFR47_03500 [Anaerolineales bacterium]|nr:hypothetical protein [Anaerolineales bacterium]